MEGSGVLARGRRGVIGQGTVPGAASLPMAHPPSGMSLVHSFCTWSPGWNVRCSHTAPGTQVWCSSLRISVHSTLRASEARLSTKERGKKRLDFILLPRFYFNFPGTVNELRRRQWPPTPVLLPGESQGWGSLVGCRLWGHTESDTTEAT